MSPQSERITKAAQTIELLMADLRDLHKSACGGPEAQPMLELVSRQLLRQCADLRQQINETRAALEPPPPEPDPHTKLPIPPGINPDTKPPAGMEPPAPGVPA